MQKSENFSGTDQDLSPKPKGKGKKMSFDSRKVPEESESEDSQREPKEDFAGPRTKIPNSSSP